MFKQTTLVNWHGDAAAAAKAALEERLRTAVQADFCHVGVVLPVSYQGGDLHWQLHFADEPAWKSSNAVDLLDSLEADPAVAGIDAVAYAPSRFARKHPALQNAIYRGLFVSVNKAAPAASRKALVNELPGMADHIPEIVNWGMNETIMSRGERMWTHVWEQEYATVDGLTGPYMTSPYHWGFADRWFDPEMPQHIVDDLRHSVIEIPASVIARY